MIIDFVFFHLAYIDPGAGMLALQVFLAGVVGTMTVYRYKLLGFFRKKKKVEETPSAPVPANSTRLHDGKGN